MFGYFETVLQMVSVCIDPLPVFFVQLRCHFAGYESGTKHGQLEGRADGYATGQLKGLEMGDEVWQFVTLHLMRTCLVARVLSRLCRKNAGVEFGGKR